ncbi:uncharacterized protein LOC119102974 [Pollicipes pollicipes]|uniref:uncharacterized protein LOC119102974 n=1 Tax=Pollicipes pollicipes TaxID=41117 RepID=UPI001884D948|nr:uncharacterized protein LOC119102974 [Pollicipes pollicipes]
MVAARTPLAFCLLTLVGTGQALLCYVCIPPLAGNPAAQNAANLMRANISRTFPGKAEYEFQECGASFDMRQSSAQAACPWDDDSVVCLDIKHAAWQARTCGRVPFDADLRCIPGENGEDGCPCPNALCNGARRVAAAPVGLAAALLALACQRA